MPNTPVIVATAALLLSPTAFADLPDIVNDIRRTGCSGERPAATRVEIDAALDAAARLIARGGDLEEALVESGYRGTSATLINIGGAGDDAGIREVLADGFCAKVNNDAFAAIGTYVRGNEFWLVLAARRFDALDESDARDAAERVLELVNAARGQERRCGRQRLGATHALTLSAPLTRAAAVHASDMATNGFVGHRGSDGGEVSDRVNRVGYRWRAVGENVAAGQLDADTVVREWLDSPGHCANIMAPRFTEMGVAVVAAPQSELRILWAQVFAAPR